MSEPAAPARPRPTLDAALAAAPLILFCVDAEGVVTFSHGRGLALLGRRPGESVGQPVWELHREHETLLAGVRRALAGEEVAVEVEMRAQTCSFQLTPLKDGERVTGALGVGVDVTDAKRAGRVQARQVAAMEASADGIALLSGGGDVLYANPAFARLAGREAAALFGKPWQERLAPEERARLDREVLPEFARRGRWRGDTVVLGPGDAPVPVEMTLAAVDGGGSVCVLRDVSERRRGEAELERLFAREQQARAQAEAARQDAAFLDEASRILDQSFDLAATLPELAAHCRGYAADACFIDLVEEDALSRAASALPESLSGEARALLSECHPMALTDPHPVAAAMRAGQPQLAADGGDPAAFAACGDPAHRGAWAQLAPRAHLVVPLVTRHRLLGALTWMATPGGRRFTPETLGLAREVGRRVALRVENARALASLDRLNEFKSRLLAVAGHDLRAPLQISLVYTQLLLSGEAGPVTKEQEQFLLKVLRVINDQKRLVESLMDFSAFGRRRLPVTRRPLDLAVLLRDVGEEARTMAEGAGLAFACAAPESLPVMGDEVRLRQVLLNLVQNACKYTRRDGRVALTGERREGAALVSVRDDGIGIPREVLGRIFEALYQVPQEGGGSPRGLGLGLAIAKELVDAHGGRIWAESEGRGRGSVFWVSLPLIDGA